MKKNYNTNINLNEFFKNVKLKKQYTKKFKDILLELANVKENNHRGFGSNKN